jgi:hypothetical protein
LSPLQWFQPAFVLPACESTLPLRSVFSLGERNCVGIRKLRAGR